MRALGIASIAGVFCVAVGCQSVEDDAVRAPITATMKARGAPSLVTESGKATKRLEGSRGSSIEFSLDVKQAGSYRMRVWGEGLAIATSTTMYIDGRLTGTVSMKDTGWQFHEVAARNGGRIVSLSAGAHTVVFRNALPRAPDIEVVQIATGEFPVAVTDSTYGDYVATLKQNVLAADYGTKKSAGWEDGGAAVAANPGAKGNYCYSESVQFNYTFRSFVYLSAGQAV